MKPGRETKKRESSRREKPWKKTLRERLLKRHEVRTLRGREAIRTLAPIYLLAAFRAMKYIATPVSPMMNPSPAITLSSETPARGLRRCACSPSTMRSLAYKTASHVSM